MAIITSDQIQSMSKMQEENSHAVQLLSQLAGELPAAGSEAERLANCSTVWRWKSYKKDKLLLLDSVNRCKSKFCPICNKIKSSRIYNNLSPKLSDGMHLHVTLTMPSLPHGDLSQGIDILIDGFRRLWDSIGCAHGKSRSYGQLRGLAAPATGALRSIEVTHNQHGWHPHLHVLFDLPAGAIASDLLVPSIDIGAWDYKRDEPTILSKFEYGLGQLWRHILSDIAELPETPLHEIFMVRARQIEDTNGLREIIKYPTKMATIASMSLDQFKELYFALRSRHIRQCYGSLYGTNANESTVDIVEDMAIYAFDIPAYSPEIIITSRKILLTEYDDWTKISSVYLFPWERNQGEVHLQPFPPAKPHLCHEQSAANKTESNNTVWVRIDLAGNFAVKGAAACATCNP